MPIAIGDIHGCLKELRTLVERLPPDQELVFLGDYVDRGPDSAGVIAYLEDLRRRRPCRLLMGNHEQLVSNAIGDKREDSIWLLNGGTATLQSYGLDASQWAQARNRESLLPGFSRFFDSLSIFHEDDSAIYVHAGLDVSIPDLKGQDPKVLVWIREAFFRNAADWKGKRIFFGHSPTRTMGLPPGRIFQSHSLYGIDTGCVYGGCLTAIDTVSMETVQVEML